MSLDNEGGNGALPPECRGTGACLTMPPVPPRLRGEAIANNRKAKKRPVDLPSAVTELREFVEKTGRPGSCQTERSLSTCNRRPARTLRHWFSGASPVAMLVGLLDSLEHASTEAEDRRFWGRRADMDDMLYNAGAGRRA